MARTALPSKLSNSSDWNQLVALATKLQTEVEASGYVTDVTSDYQLGTPELVVTPDRGGEVLVSNLVREASSAYASHHYNVYHFLLTLSDVAGGEGLEHGQSSDNGVEEKGYSEPGFALMNSHQPSVLYQSSSGYPR